jgi:hypothetical protein
MTIMPGQDHQQNANTPNAVLGNCFTSEEAARLLSLRETFNARADSQRVLDERRLEFARWLHETGRLREELQ